MREKPISPELNGLELPQPPLPWEPSKCHDLITGFPDGAFWRLSKIATADIRQPLNEYLSWLEGRYVLPGNVAGIVRDSIRFDSPLASILFTTQSETDYSSMMKRFEQDYLGLPPTDSNDGLRWRESNAGFSSGQYPTETIASLVNMDSVQLLEYIKANKAPVGWVAIKSDDFLIPVTDNYLSEEVVTIDGVQELTSTGNEFLKEILSVYEKGLRANS